MSSSVEACADKDGKIASAVTESSWSSCGETSLRQPSFSSAAINGGSVIFSRGQEGLVPREVGVPGSNSGNVFFSREGPPSSSPNRVHSVLNRGSCDGSTFGVPNVTSIGVSRDGCSLESDKSRSTEFDNGTPVAVQGRLPLDVENGLPLQVTEQHRRMDGGEWSPSLAPSTPVVAQVLGARSSSRFLSRDLVSPLMRPTASAGTWQGNATCHVQGSNSQHSSSSPFASRDVSSPAMHALSSPSPSRGYPSPVTAPGNAFSPVRNFMSPMIRALNSEGVGHPDSAMLSPIFQALNSEGVERSGSALGKLQRAGDKKLSALASC